ncbi:MAG: hypothetical protein GY913_25875 [Proteobacteria bacterium]|nr:hypothetical protein [Pseudomonadota bacterium]MCP4920345.1 hypothetical protein [Pseudomonadota bacterium]
MLLLASLACGTKSTADRVEPTFIYVTVLADDLGSEESPLPFSSETAQLPVRVETLDSDAEPYPFTGDLSVNVRPGRLDQQKWVTVTDGVWEGEIEFGNGFGPTRVWFSDEGDKDAGTGRVSSYATGVSDPPMVYEFPTLGELNEIDDVESNQLFGEFTEIRAIDRDIRVTAVGVNGYWVTDMADEPGSYNNLFVYTFSRPEEAAVVGARISLLNGANQEYLGTTQLSFPSYDVTDDPIVDVPEASVITATDCADLQKLEGFESGLVRLEDVTVPASFTQGNEDYEDYLEYGQWPIGDCLYVDSSGPIPDFTPTAGQDIPYIEGMLNQVFDMYVILPRDANDLAPAAGGPPSDSHLRMPHPAGEFPHSHAPGEPCLP